MAEFRLTDRKYAETEYVFQTIEMAKSDEEYEAELCTPPPGLQDCEELLCFEHKLQANKIIEKKNRQCGHRRFTFSNGSPPAPPSTPTSLTINCPSPLSSPTAKTVNSLNESDRLHNSQVSAMQGSPTLSSRYLKKLKEHHRTDAELSQLFKIVTLTAKNSCFNEFKRNSSPERGVSAASRTIRKHVSTKIFKIHRNPKEFFRDPDDEDSVSAPEYDTHEECRLARYKHSKRYLQSRRQRRFARFQHQERMEAMLDIFDATMNINDA